MERDKYQYLIVLEKEIQLELNEEYVWNNSMFKSEIFGYGDRRVYISTRKENHNAEGMCRRNIQGYTALANPF